MSPTQKENSAEQLGQKTQDPKSISLDEVKLGYICGESAYDHGLKVQIGRAGGGSFANTGSKEITMDQSDCESEEKARFIAAHEGAHIAHTPSLEQLGKSPEQIEQIVKNTGLLSLRNVIEDGAINDYNVHAFRASGIAADTLASYPRINSEEPVGFINHPEVAQVAALLGRLPLFAQALGGLLADWSELRHQKGFDCSYAELKKEARQGGGS